MLVFEEGTDIFETSAKTITITVNCVGVMGKGIAKTAREQSPELFARYKKWCEAGEIRPGVPRLTMNGRYLLFPTKDHWRQPSQYAWIKEGLQRIRKNIHHLESIAIPPLGCGNGGLEWREVKLLTIGYLASLDIPIHIYPPRNWV